MMDISRAEIASGCHFPRRGWNRAWTATMGDKIFVGKYAALACWNYNLEADEDFFLNTTNYFATKYGITI